jgi:hypothetical protein
MRAYSLSELFTLTRAELFGLHAQIVAELPALPAGERNTAFDNFRKLRRMLAHPHNAPGLAARIC